MLAFLYFIEDRQTITAADLKALGLGYLLESDSSPFVRVQTYGAGPGGKSGLTLRAGADGADLGYFPARQTWRKIVDRGPLAVDRNSEEKTEKDSLPLRSTDHGLQPTAGVWIGYENAAPPTPADLARPEQVAGYQIQIDTAEGGCATWTVPVARSFRFGMNLPASLAIGPDGKLVKEVLPRYAAASARAEALWRRIAPEADPQGGQPSPCPLPEGEGKEDQIDLAEAFAAAVDALSINYRVSAAEVSILRLLTTQNVMTVIYCFVDFPAYLPTYRARLEELKKKDSGPLTPPAS